jgi:N-acetylglucosamine-6-phosphate deacetylase
MLAVAGGARRGAVVVEGERIAEVVLDPSPADLPAEVRDAAWVSPGLIDWQVNGAYGVDVAADERALAVLSARLPEQGVTGYLPTVVSADLAAYESVAARLAAHQGTGGARALGLHLEGPFLAPERGGAHAKSAILAADSHAALFDRLLALPGLRLMTLAPERPGARERIARLRAAGVAVSLGHTAADHAALRAGVDAGATLVTHLYNAMTGFAHRAPGAVGAALTDDRVALGLVADGVHCHPIALSLALRAAGAERIALTTDSMAAAGMPPGRYTLAGRAVVADGASARLPDGTLAGSTLALDQAIRNMVAWCGAAPDQAMRMASVVAARALGIDHDLAPGRRADVTLFDAALRVAGTVIGGRRSWSQGS